MRFTFVLLILLLSSSCAAIKWANTSGAQAPEQVIPAKSNKELWIGKKSDDLILHPLFATKVMDRRKASNDVEVITFKNSAGVEGRNEAGLFGTRHSTANEVSCNHVFYLKKDAIYDYQRIGACTEEEDPGFAPKA